MDTPFLKPLTEQVRRVELLLTIAQQASTNPVIRHRLLVVAVYPAAAIAHLMIDNPTKVNSGEEEVLKKELEDTVRFYRLVMKVRLHDFHRTTVMPPIAGRETMRSAGPFRLTSRQGGVAQMQGIGPDKKLITTRNSSIKQDRPLETMDGQVWDDSSGNWFDLFDVLRAYLKSILPFVEEREGSIDGAEAENDE